MKRLLAFVALLLVAGSAAAEPVVGREAQGVPYFGSSTLCDRSDYRFPSGGLAFTVFRRQSDGQVHDFRLNLSLGGRLGEFTPALTGGARLGPVLSAWQQTRADGSLVAGATAALVNPTGEKLGVFSLRRLRLPQYANWVFLRARTSGPDGTPAAAPRLSGFWCGAHMQPLPMVVHPRTYFVAWPGGEARGGDSLPWNRQKPAFNALALWVRGQDEEDLSDFLVFDPEAVTSLYFQRWNYGDGVTVMLFSLQPTQEVTFALGTERTENAEHVAVPRFLTEDRERVAAALRAANWEVTVDTTALQRNAAQIGELLQANPNPDLQKRYDDLEARLAALAPQDPDTASGLELEGRALLEAAAARLLADQLGVGR